MEKAQTRHLMSMRMMIIFLLGLTHASYCQYNFTGKIYSVKDSLPIKNAFVQCGSSSSYSNGDGIFQISLPELRIARISIHHPGYESILCDTNVKFNHELIFYLKEAELIGNVLEFSAGPQVVFGSEIWNVGDFAWDHNGEMLILTYEEEERWKKQEDANKTLFRGGRVLKLDKRDVQMLTLNTDQSQYDVLEIPGSTLGFYDQFPGEIIVQGHHQFFLIYQTEDDWDLIPLSDSLMKHQITPVVDTLRKGEFIISDFEPSYPAMDFYLNVKNEWKSFYHIIDEKEMELFRSEYKYLGPKEKVEAYQFQLDHGIDKEVVAAYMRGFQHTHFHSELYTPLLIMGDTLMIFDHLHDEVTLMNKRGELLSKEAIHYHKLKGMGSWSGKIWKDPVTKRIYTAYNKHGRTTLLEIFPRQDGYQVLFTLTHSFVQKIRIRGGDIFYIYKPFESTKKRYLFKEKIRYE